MVYIISLNVGFRTIEKSQVQVMETFFCRGVYLYHRVCLAFHLNTFCQLGTDLDCRSIQSEKGILIFILHHMYIIIVPN